MKIKKIATLTITVLAVAIFATAAYCFLGGADPSRDMGNYRSFSFYADRPGNSAAIWLQPGSGPPNPGDEFWFDNSGTFNLPGGIETPGPVSIGGTAVTVSTASEFQAALTNSSITKITLTASFTSSEPLELTNSNQIIDFNGHAVTFTNTTTGSRAGLTNWNNGSPSDLSGLTLENGTLNFTAATSMQAYQDDGVELAGNCTGIRIKNLVINNAPNTGIMISGEDGPSAAKDIIKDCIIVNPYDEGIQFNGGISAIIENNFIEGAGWSGIDTNGTQVIIRNNYCWGNGQNTLTGASQIDNISENGINLLIPPVQTNTYGVLSNVSAIVSDNNVQSNGNSTNPGNGIYVGTVTNQATGQTTTSSTSLTMGTGNQTLTVPSGLTWPYPTCPIQIAYTSSPTTDYETGTITSYSGTTLVVSISSITGSGSYSAWTIANESSGGPYQSQDKHISITNNFVLSNNRGGIWLYGLGEATIEGNILDNNGSINETSNTSSGWNLIGSIAISPGENAGALNSSQVNGGIIAGNIINDAIGCGIVLNGSGWQIHDNLISGSSSNSSSTNPADAIYFMEQNSGAWTAGLAQTGPSWSQVANNEISGNFQYDVYLQGNCTSNRIQNNDFGATVADSQYYGKGTNGNQFNIFSGNRFTYGDLSGTVTLANGTATVSTPEVQSGDTVVFSRLSPNSSTAIGSLSLGTITSGSQFVINSLTDTNTVATGDQSTVYWQIVH